MQSSTATERSQPSDPIQISPDPLSRRLATGMIFFVLWIVNLIVIALVSPFLLYLLVKRLVTRTHNVAVPAVGASLVIIFNSWDAVL